MHRITSVGSLVVVAATAVLAACHGQTSEPVSVTQTTGAELAAPTTAAPANATPRAPLANAEAAPVPLAPATTATGNAASSGTNLVDRGLRNDEGSASGTVPRGRASYPPPNMSRPGGPLVTPLEVSPELVDPGLENRGGYSNYQPVTPGEMTR